LKNEAIYLKAHSDEGAFIVSLVPDDRDSGGSSHYYASIDEALDAIRDYVNRCAAEKRAAIEGRCIDDPFDPF